MDTPSRPPADPPPAIVAALRASLDAALGDVTRPDAGPRRGGEERPPP